MLDSTGLARAAGLALFAISIAGCQQSAAPPEQPAAFVKAETVALVPYTPTLTLTGSIRARAETPLAFQISGQITELSAEIGQRVTEGQLIGRLSSAEQQANVTAAEASVAAANAQLTQAQTTFDRQNSLLNQGLTTRSGFETAQTALTTAQNSLDSAQAQLETARQGLGYTELRANAAGIITERRLEVGEVVQAGSPVYVLAEDGPRDAVFNVQETALIGRSAETPVQVALVADPNVAVSGTVHEVSPTVDPQTGTVEVTIAIAEPPASMTLGAAVVGTVSSSVSDRIVLPWSALWSEDGKPAVWTVGEDETVSVTPVSVLAYGTGVVVIADGLTPGQRVVTEGTKLLTPGETVQIEDAP
ncbi:hypothetical protein VW35_01725 [Devosia soli]|uniref:Uncharacterized protein n=1 Tax=Devosia soli TaxID=361041 RepID=A0A0F5LF51_9HYPH|nr:efflux RND transporter periplasmic adaptor subunit [Devosia soli]KKB80930.1 hypothetical protein VW35_01725 [Devosia soli]